MGPDKDYLYMMLVISSMNATPATDTEKSRVYREYRNGEASEEDVCEVFGKDVEEFEAFDSLMDVVDSTPTNEATDDLFC